MWGWVLVLVLVLCVGVGVGGGVLCWCRCCCRCWCRCRCRCWCRCSVFALVLVSVPCVVARWCWCCVLVLRVVDVSAGHVEVDAAIAVAAVDASSRVRLITAAFLVFFKISFLLILSEILDLWCARHVWHHKSVGYANATTSLSQVYTLVSGTSLSLTPISNDASCACLVVSCTIGCVSCVKRNNPPRVL